jgi:hypothetical protein
MKCQEFVFNVRDLARHQLDGKPLGANLREQALAHAQQCAACAARLADERQLTAGLATWVLADQPLGASAAVESALLAAFRQQPTPATAPVVAFPVQPRPAWVRWTLAAAAVLLVSLLAWAMRGWLPGAASGEQPAPTLTEAPPAPAATPNVLAPTLAVERSAATASPRSVPRGLTRPKRAAPRYRIERYLVESEIATDFLPLTDRATWPRREHLQTVRVQLPRSVLASFGLPMSVERATEPVAAELLIGADGLTRAIRFIQTELEEPQIISANNPSSKEQ